MWVALEGGQPFRLDTFVQVAYSSYNDWKETLFSKWYNAIKHKKR